MLVAVAAAAFLAELSFGVLFICSLTGREVLNGAAIINDPLGCLELSIKFPFQGQNL